MSKQEEVPNKKLFKVPSSKEKPTVLVDFDGVIHSYESGWQGADIVPDDPLPGAMEWLEEMTKKFHVVIFSTRAGHRDLNQERSGERAIRDALKRWSIRKWGTIPQWIKEIGVTNEKIPAFLIIDDRAIRFLGDFNLVSPENIERFTPWNK